MVFSSLAKVGLHMKVKKLNLLDEEQWQIKKNHPELIIKIKKFLWDEIK